MNGNSNYHPKNRPTLEIVSLLIYFVTLLYTEKDLFLCYTNNQNRSEMTQHKVWGVFLSILLLGTTVVSCSNAGGDDSLAKPRVWIISDGNDNSLHRPNGRHITDPDDVSALATYLLMSNRFDTRGIVVASSSGSLLTGKPSQATWAKEYFGKAYQEDLPNLNKYIGGYQAEIPFYESFLKEHHTHFAWEIDYTDITPYPSVQKAVSALKESTAPLYVMNWGNLTEAAILVRHLEQTNQNDLLRRLIFISHWTHSTLHVGTVRNPANTHNCRADAGACDYMHIKASDGLIKFYECGGIGQAGIVENSRLGDAYHEQYKNSALGRIFVEGKYIRGGVDDSDAATVWALIGGWGVSLDDISSSGLNFPEVEKRNEEAFAKHAKDIRNEIRRRARAAAGYPTGAVYVNSIAPDRGLADPHVLIVNDTLYTMCGHDKTWNTTDFCHMDRWELWSTTNLRDWNFVLDIKPTQTYIGDEDNCWAGDLAYKDGTYYWYFSNRNFNTGVMSAPTMHGPWKDALGKPLLPTDIVPNHKPYDPEIYVENGEYYIIFGVSQYHMAKLGDDMISLASKPQKILIYNKEGKRQHTGDKPTMFKRGDWYYLWWGYRYAMSKKLEGPYEYQGSFLDGGHGSVFKWHDQWYSIQENHETNAFYRGVQLRPLYFNPDGKVYIPEMNYEYPLPGRVYDFEHTTQGWQGIQGTTADRGIYPVLQGEVSEKGAIVASTAFLHTALKPCKQVIVRMRNKSKATKMKVAMYTYEMERGFTRKAPQKVDWSKEYWVEVPIKQDGGLKQEFTIPLSAFKGHDKFMHQIAVQPVADVSEGAWMIDEIRVE